MKKIVISSIGKGAGKTTLILGLAKVLGKSIGYMKPFGDRLLYRKKRLWDYDSAMVTHYFNLEESPEEMSIGFEHAKLRYMYDESSIKKKLHEVEAHVGKGKELLFVETGRDLACGSSIHLDAITVTKELDGELLVVVSGDDDRIMDEIAFIKKYIDTANIKFSGVIINKVIDLDDFKSNILPVIDEMGINVYGIVPYKEELARATMSFISDVLFAKVITGSESLNRIVKRVFVAAMSASAALEVPMFKEPGNLVISSGDRPDMLVAALETDPAGIILCGNILPSSNIISKASELKVPMLLVVPDTFRVAKQIDDLEPLITKDAPQKVEIIEKLVEENVSFRIVSSK